MDVALFFGIIMLIGLIAGFAISHANNTCTSGTNKTANKITYQTYQAPHQLEYQAAYEKWLTEDETAKLLTSIIDYAVQHPESVIKTVNYYETITCEIKQFPKVFFTYDFYYPDRNTRSSITINNITYNNKNDADYSYKKILLRDLLTRLRISVNNYQDFLRKEKEKTEKLQQEMLLKQNKHEIKNYLHSLFDNSNKVSTETLDKTKTLNKEEKKEVEINNLKDNAIPILPKKEQDSSIIMDYNIEL